MDLNEPIPIETEIDWCEDEIHELKAQINDMIEALYFVNRELQQATERLEDYLDIQRHENGTD